MTVADLKRFGSWTQGLEDLTLSVRVEGTEILEWKTTGTQTALWPRIFAPSLSVDLLDTAEELRKAQSDPLPVPVLPPTAEGAAIFKGLYRQRLRQQLAGLPKSESLAEAFPDDLTGVETATWRNYVDRLKVLGDAFQSAEADGASLFRRATRVMQLQEAFHSRPPMRLFPHLIRDEKKRTWTEVELKYSGATTGVRRPLPRLAEAGDGEVIQSAPPGTGVIALAALGDPICGGGLGFRLRPGDRIFLASRDAQWFCESAEVQVQDSDDGGILYARPMELPEGRKTRVKFLLPPPPPPPAPAPDFTVTLRCLGESTATVTLNGKDVSIEQGAGRTFSRRGGVWEERVENPLEFHRLIASMRSYPDLLRLLGLVIDVKISSDIQLPSRGRIRVVPKGPGIEEDLCPFTEFEFCSDHGLFQPRTNDPHLDQGMLSNGPERKRFRLIQLDSDSAALKNLQQVRTQILFDKSASTSEAAGPLSARGEPQEGGDLATLRQIGLSLCDLGAEADTKRALRKAVDFTRALCGSAGATCAELASVPDAPDRASFLLHAEDLLQGYRVDVFRRRPAGAEGPWRSLCERKGTYTLANPSKSGDGLSCAIDSDAEGWVSVAADEVCDPKGELDPNDTKPPVRALRQSQAIFRWDGWSLVAERPGSAFSETGSNLKASADGDANAPVQAKFKAKAGSLERLRLGDRYSFRLRTVDLAGNSLSLCDANELLTSATDPRMFNSGCYERPEPLGAPVLIPMQQPKEGEANDQLVIRSTECTGHDREWLLLPPGAPPSFVELHGVLDGYGAKEAWEILRDHDNLTPTWNEHSRGYDLDWLQEYWSPLSAKLRRLPYLPDPLFQRVHFRQRDPEGAPINVASLDLGGRKGERYPNKIQGRALRLSAGKRPRVNETGRALEFCLPPGRIAKVEIASCPSEDELSKFGLLAWCKCNPKDKDFPCDEVEPAGPAISIAEVALHKACCAGDLGLITPSREISLVHAVEKPLVPEGRERLGFVSDQTFRFGNPIQVTLDSNGSGSGSSPGSLFGVKGTTWIDRASAGKLDFRLEWVDLLDIPSVPQVVEKPNAIQLFQTPVPLDAGDYVRFEADSSADCAPTAPPGGKGCSPRDSFPFEGKVRFDDTKHHKADMRFDATSRFVDCFPPPNPEGSDSASKRKDPDGRFRRTSESITVHFPSRKAPALPTPIYMVPTFRFSKRTEGSGVTTSRRGGLRIFLARDWFSSGPDEMLALVFAPTLTRPLPPLIAPMVSAWGADPLWEPRDSPPYDRQAVGMPILPERPLLKNVLNMEREEQSLVGVIPIAPADNSSPDDPKSIEVELDVAAFTPRLDKEKNLWFVDVDIQAPTYFPFLRLGLARFQPFAEEGCQLSGLVAAAFCQLVPDVDVSAVPGKKRCIEVTVLAPATPYVGEAPEGTRTLRWFDLLVVASKPASNELALQIPDRLNPIRLQHQGNGDGQAKWFGAVPAERLKRGSYLLVVERQGWQIEGEPAGARLVGCIPVSVAGLFAS